MTPVDHKGNGGLRFLDTSAYKGQVRRVKLQRIPLLLWCTLTYY